jgi:endonuclease YncB( thermonuclease family)
MSVVITQKHGYTDRHGRVYLVGAVLTGSADLEDKLVRNGIAAPAPAPEKKPAKPEPKAAAEEVETAAVRPPQNAAKRTGKLTPRKKD